MGSFPVRSPGFPFRPGNAATHPSSFRIHHLEAGKARPWE
jgi:hypothetical protein